jgi:hypothetical protein
MTTQQPASGQERARRYTPLAIASTCILIAIFGLPSMLNLPQSNPGQVAEYAPVPPDEDNTAPSGGNFAGLGLGTGSTLTEGADEAPTGDFNPTRMAQKSNFRCVVINGVARQTEDPLSPPCVPFYEGDNGGSTYKGVTRDSINVVYYFACSETNNTYSPTSKGQEGATCGQLDDLDKPPSDDDFVYTRGLKRYAAYFNSRYQTYKRHVHMWAFYGHFTVAVTGPGGCRADCRKADATQINEKQKPFAVVTSGGDYIDDFAFAMAQKRVVNFGGTAHHDSFYRQYPGLLWNYGPTYEQQAAQYASFLCQKAAKHPVSFSGSGDNGKKRKFAMIYYNVEGDQTAVEIKNLVRKRLQACGVPKPAEYSYNYFCSVCGFAQGGAQQQAQLTEMRQNGVTTLLWIGPQNGDWTRSAQQLNWFPEWIVFGDGSLEDFVTGRYSEQSEWEHAWIVTNVTRIRRQDDQPCALALREVDPGYPSVDLPWVCGFYDNLRQMFTGIQVAGPQLTPATIDQGFHSIPAVPSTNPEVPACFYRSGDYTCVKDAVAMWWDPDGQIRGWSGQGCYRNVTEGRRYLENEWPSGNVDAQKSPSKDVCNGYTSNSSLNPYAQTG